MLEIYKRIRARREGLGISQEELAKRMGYKSRSSINKIEKGENDIPLHLSTKTGHKNSKNSHGNLNVRQTLSKC